MKGYVTISTVLGLPSHAMKAHAFSSVGVGIQYWTASHRQKDADNNTQNEC